MNFTCEDKVQYRHGVDGCCQCDVIERLEVTSYRTPTIVL